MAQKTEEQWPEIAGTQLREVNVRSSARMAMNGLVLLPAEGRKASARPLSHGVSPSGLLCCSQLPSSTAHALDFTGVSRHGNVFDGGLLCSPGRWAWVPWPRPGCLELIFVRGWDAFCLGSLRLPRADHLSLHSIDLSSTQFLALVEAKKHIERALMGQGGQTLPSDFGWQSGGAQLDY